MQNAATTATARPRLAPRGLSAFLAAAVAVAVALFGFGPGAAPLAAAQGLDDPANAIVLTVGSGYDGPQDASPARTAEVVIQLLPRFAPNHVNRIKDLTREGYYNGKLFHRVIDGFMAQTGSPRGDGIGGSDKPNLKAEFSNVKFERGVVGMARTGDPDSANAQFFIMFDRSASLDALYTVVGIVTSGMEAVDDLTRTHDFRDRPLGVAPDRIVSARLLQP